MTAEKFTAFLDDPKQVDKDNYNDIQKLTEQFPYFQTAHVLLLLYANENDKKNFDKYAEKSAVFITDRTRLFELTRQTKSNAGSAKQPKERKSVTNSRTVNIPSKSEKQKLDERLKQIEEAAKKEQKPEDSLKDKQKREVKKDGPDDKTKEISKKAEDKTVKQSDESGDPLSDSGSKTHNALLDDLFKEKVRKREEEKQKSQKEEQKEKETNLTKKKTDEVSSEELTNDIYNKIAGLKRDKLKVKNISSEEVQKTDKTKADKNTKTEEDEPKTHVNKPDEIKAKELEKDKPDLNDEALKEKQKNENDKKDLGQKTESKTSEKELSAAEKLTDRIKKVKSGISNEPEKLSDSKKPEKQTEDKDKTRKEKKSDQSDKVFEMSDAKTEQKETKESETSQKTEKTAADSILERINRLKGEKDVKKEKLIEEFVKKEPRMERTKDKEPEIEGDVAEESTKEKEPVVTELMANIYINQGYYDKAIEVFEKLILKNPKKKDYFAAKIQETEEMK